MRPPGLPKAAEGRPPPPAAKKDPASILLSELYTVDATAPASATALPAEDLARWYASTIYAEMCLPNLSAIERARSRERGTQAALLISLANQLHLREHGKAPETVEALIGPYLSAMPEGYSNPKGR